LENYWKAEQFLGAGKLIKIAEKFEGLVSV
jgi:hypothetical protein